jgi:hypothetical protein
MVFIPTFRAVESAEKPARFLIRPAASQRRFTPSETIRRISPAGRASRSEAAIADATTLCDRKGAGPKPDLLVQDHAAALIASMIAATMI